MKKNKVRLTEAQLQKVINGSIKKVLKEGRWLNNNPMQKNGRIYRPGEEIENPDDDFYTVDGFHYYDNNWQKIRDKDKNERIADMHKHNQRAEKWDAPYKDGFNPNKGDMLPHTRRSKEIKDHERGSLAKIIRFSGIPAKEVYFKWKRLGDDDKEKILYMIADLEITLERTFYPYDNSAYGEGLEYLD